MLTKLKWDVSTVTPQDFLLLFIYRLPLEGLVDRDMVIKHAQTFISFAARGEFKNRCSILFYF